MLSDFGKDFISYERPDNRLLIGQVIRTDKEYVHIKLYEDVEEGWHRIRNFKEIM